MAQTVFLPLVERLCHFSANLSIALDPDSGCRASPLVRGVKQDVVFSEFWHCANYRNWGRVMEWNHKSFRSYTLVILRRVWYLEDEAGLAYLFSFGTSWCEPPSTLLGRRCVGSPTQTLFSVVELWS